MEEARAALKKAQELEEIIGAERGRVKRLVYTLDLGSARGRQTLIKFNNGSKSAGIIVTLSLSGVSSENTVKLYFNGAIAASKSLISQSVMTDITLIFEGECRRGGNILEIDNSNQYIAKAAVIVFGESLKALKV